MKKNYPINYNTIIQENPIRVKPSNNDLLSVFRDEADRLTALPLGILPTFYILNYQTKEYEFISKAFQCFSKYKVEEIIEGGIEKFLSIYQKDDFELYSDQIFAKNVQVLLNVTPEEREKLIFANTYRIFNNDKTISHILQKNRIICDSFSGLPIYAYGCIHNLTHHKVFNRELFHQIEKIEDLETGSKSVIFSNTYKVYEEDKMLTPQENRIVELLIKGLTTKEIAQKLFVSYHTIDAHRSNILTKTNSKNVVQLISKFMNSNI